MRQTPKVFEVQERVRGLYRPAKFGRARISPADGAAKNVEFFVCLFVTLLDVSLCARFRHEGVGMQKRF